MSILPATSLDATQLFKRLVELEKNGSCPSALSGNVQAICSEAAARLKIFPAIHGEFTLHDETHCLRVVQLMRSAAASVAERLNALEIALLILGAYFHDQGMIVDAEELDRIRSTDEWTLHEQNWIADHPNYGEMFAKLSDPLLTDVERRRTSDAIADLRAAMFTGYIRQTHGERSGRFVQHRYGQDPRLLVNERSLADLVALICVAHAHPPDAITPSNGFRFDELVGTERVNVALVAHILRLADILDFDRERTPDSLYRAIQFTSDISLLEWHKHRSVTGWEIAPDRILFAAECEHPAYERAIREFFGWMNAELVAVEAWGRSLPASFEHHRLHLPQRVDESRVGPRVNPVTHRPIYRYFDLEFSISRDEIVKLLMTDGLYSSKSLFVRELLQNALDALRHRRARYRSYGTSLSDLRVEFEHIEDSGFDIVRCRDNGVGMDEEIVTRFLTRVGRSYYRSPEFEQERAQLKNKGCDFDPCARFGIGFMSCFMFGDEITIQTRRDCGVGRAHGQPLVVEMRGLSGIVVIRPGSDDQPVGTTVEIRGRRRSFTVDRWSDPVNLVEVLKGYAVAVEFPITARCTVPAIAERVTIASAATAQPHPLEEANVCAREVFAEDFSAADERLGGQIRVCMLTDDAGIPTAANAEGRVELYARPRCPSERRITLAFGGATIDLREAFYSNRVCCDGILVCGRPGRHDEYPRLGYTSLNTGFGDASFLLDARSDLKPELTPARTPPRFRRDENESWGRLFAAAAPAYSRLLRQILDRCVKREEPDRFWVVAAAYNLDVYHLPLADIWTYLRVPVARRDAPIEWLAVTQLGSPRVTLPTTEKQPLTLVLPNERHFKLPSTISSFQCDEDSYITLPFFERLIMGLSKITVVSPTELELSLQEPKPDVCLANLVWRSFPWWNWHFRLADNLAHAICIVGDAGFANVEHAVVRLARSIRYKPWEAYTPLERIMSALACGRVGAPFHLAERPNSWGARCRKELGMLYLTVDWDGVDSSLRPPYHIFRPGIGIEALTSDHLAQWAEMAFEPDD